MLPGKKWQIKAEAVVKLTMVLALMCNFHERSCQVANCMLHLGDSNQWQVLIQPTWSNSSILLSSAH